MGAVMLLLYKIADVAALVAIAQWVVVYTVLTRRTPWWRNRIGQTLVLVAGFLFGQYVLIGLAVFFSLSRQTSRAVGWVFLGFVAVVAVAFVHRSFIWVAASRRGDTGKLPAGERDG